MQYLPFKGSSRSARHTIIEFTVETSGVSIGSVVPSAPLVGIIEFTVETSGVSIGSLVPSAPLVGRHFKPECPASNYMKP